MGFYLYFHLNLMDYLIRLYEYKRGVLRTLQQLQKVIDSEG